MKQAKLKLSPSALERHAACPSSYWAEGKFPYTESPAAAEGKLLHGAMAGEPVKLTLPQRRYVETARLLARSLVEQYLPGLLEKERPANVWATTEDARSLHEDTFYVSGKFDWWGSDEETAVLIDYKFGHSQVESAEANMQMMAYAIVAARNSPPGKFFRRVIVAIIQPTVDYEHRLTVAEYGIKELQEAADILAAIASAIEDARTTPKYRAGLHCTYCKAAASCEENRARLVQLEPSGMPLVPTNEQLGAWLKKAKGAKSVIENIERAVREKLEAGEEVPGWTLKYNPPMRIIEDVPAVWQKLNGRGVEADEFMRLCKLSIGDIDSLVRAKSGCLAKEAMGITADWLGESVVLKPKAQTVSEVK